MSSLPATVLFVRAAAGTDNPGPPSEHDRRQGTGEKNLRVNTEGYRAQMITMTEVLDAQALLTRARVNYYKALYFHNLAKANLQRAVGTY